MIKIITPNKFSQEKTYIIDILFKSFLGIDYIINNNDGITDYKIILDNGNNIIIKDHFFSKLAKGDTYLNIKNIPEDIRFSKNQFTVEADISIIYGTDELKVTDDKIICGIDVFASAFFMLTRWEEYVDKARDIHNRFPASESLAFKNNFMDRPVVNEYVEILWNMLKHLGHKQERKKRNFEIILTHDVDNLHYWKYVNIPRALAGDIIKRKSLKLAKSRFSEFVSYKLGKSKDPYDTFDWLMDLSESVDIKSRFYFMSGGTTHFDNEYSINEKKCLKVINRIKDRGHIIGFHPSYNAYNDSIQWKKEKDDLETVLGFQVKEGRNHYLRFEAPTTWQIWNDNSMEMDCTVGYADREGFRCGTCYEFKPFNFLTRKKLNVKEYPLTIMEGTLAGYRGLAPCEMKKRIALLKGVTKRYSGKFVLLWHNSSFNTNEWAGYKSIYAKLMNKGF